MQDYDERIEIIKQATNHVQNRKTIDELDFERSVAQVDDYIMGWGDE